MIDILGVCDLILRARDLALISVLSKQHNYYFLISLISLILLHDT